MGPNGVMPIPADWAPQFILPELGLTQILMSPIVQLIGPDGGGEEVGKE